MKYEAVFGNQELFDGAGTFTGLDVVVHSIASGIKSYARLSDLTPESLRNHPVCAMRRIIKEPKRWTWEDKKAGVLPEVGSKYNVDGFIVEHLGNGSAGYENIIYFKYPSGSCGHAYELSAKPIETPAEKAQREEDEFVESTCRQNEPHSTLYSDGVRAAYRKLKGGE
jgi:hypothetical protein